MQGLEIEFGGRKSESFWRVEEQKEPTQAGAMQAIYDFLEENGAVNNVRMIAGSFYRRMERPFVVAD